MTPAGGRSAARVLIAGGGPAALETLLALRDLAADALEATLLSPRAELVERPAAVGEPFGLGAPRRHALAPIVRDCGATLVRDALEAVDVARREARTSAGTRLPYDALVVAVGARAVPAHADALAFTGDDPSVLHELVADVRAGRVRGIAFVAPHVAGWPLPLYELAILTARDAWRHGVGELRLWLVSPEARPLELFGRRDSDAIAELLDECAVSFLGGRHADVRPGQVVLDPDGEALPADRAVTLGVPAPRAIVGLPAAPDGFLPVDAHGRVAGAADVWAAGDAVSFPVKQGGLAAQQADAVAASVAARFGLVADPEPFRPVLRGMLLTGGRERWLAGGDERAAGPLWWPPVKVTGRHLAPYLGVVEPPPPPGYRAVERALD